jgi:DNA-binding CsgD family transcriptional regulator
VPKALLSDLELLRFLTPHMKRASYLHFKISALRQMGGDLQTALDQLSSGVILVGHDRKILAMNVHARRLVTQSDGLSVIHERLTASSPSESEKLQNLLKQSQATSESRGLNPGSGLTVTRRDGSKLMVLVSPISMRSLSPQIDGARTVVFIHDPSRKHRPSIQILQSLFALTPAECRVASLLAQGFSPPEIAALVGVSRNTLKTQLASMYRKTGTSRQGQLLKLLLQVCLR